MDLQHREEAHGQADDKAWPIKTFALVAGSLVVVLVILWLLIPWEWSPIDDAQQVLLLQKEILASGRMQGSLVRFGQLFQADPELGVFRPPYWLFQVVIYQLPVSIAHVVRLLMVIAAILGPVIYFRRNGAGNLKLWFILLLFIAGASTLYQGLFLTSLQELSGAALVGLGLMVKRSWIRMGLWLIAALFKSPFSWLLIGYSVYLWRKNRRLEALTTGLLGFGVLGLNAVLSRSGTYTSGYKIDLLNFGMYENFSRLIEPMNALLLVSLVWWMIVTNASFRRQSDWVMFFIGWSGYTLQMITWGVTAYYMGPISYLFVIFLAAVIADTEKMTRIQILIGLAMPAFVAFWLTRITLNLGFEINSVMVESRQCLAALSGSHTVIAGHVIYVTTSPEGPIQIQGALKINDPSWTGSIVLEDSELSGFLNPDTTHYLTIGDAPVPEGRNANQVCTGNTITLHELGLVQVL